MQDENTSAARKVVDQLSDDVRLYNYEVVKAKEQFEIENSITHHFKQKVAYFYPD